MGRAGFQKGYSLLEMLAALTILSLIVVLAMPNLGKILSTIEFNTKSERYMRDIAALRIRAFLDKRQITVPSESQGSLVGEPPSALEDTDVLLEIANEGWSLVGGPVIFLQSGVCLGGDLTLISPSGRSKSFTLIAPDCAVE